MSEDATMTLKVPSDQMDELERFISKLDIPGAKVTRLAEEPSLTRRKPLGEIAWVEIIVSAATSAFAKELSSAIVGFLNRKEKKKTFDQDALEDKNEE